MNSKLLKSLLNKASNKLINDFRKSINEKGFELLIMINNKKNNFEYYITFSSNEKNFNKALEEILRNIKRIVFNIYVEYKDNTRNDIDIIVFEEKDKFESSSVEEDIKNLLINLEKKEVKKHIFNKLNDLIFIRGKEEFNLVFTFRFVSTKGLRINEFGMSFVQCQIKHVKRYRMISLFW